MNILVACEESQRVCMAFREKGHRAFSCDVIECSGGHPEWHIMQDVIPLLNGRCAFTTCDGKVHQIDSRWDMLIAHPPVQGCVPQVKDGYILVIRLIGQIKYESNKRLLCFL